LQVLDDGRLTDNKGRTADFKNTIIIMTSNMGADVILENFEDLDAVGDKHRTEIIETTKVEVFEKLKENLRPEFLNRIDEKIMFLPLTKPEIRQILDLQLKSVQKLLSKQGMMIRMSDKGKDLLADLGYEPQFGARPMKRVLQKEVVNELAKYVLDGTFAAGDTIYIDADAKGLTFGKNPFPGAVNLPPDEDDEAETPVKPKENGAAKTPKPSNDGGAEPKKG
jgi:ATP-dependent Clp protease ATP-binding subunit ClpB